MKVYELVMVAKTGKTLKLCAPNNKILLTFWNNSKTCFLVTENQIKNDDFKNKNLRRIIFLEFRSYFKTEGIFI